METPTLSRAEYEQRLSQPLGFILSYIAGDPDSLLLEAYNPITATPLKLYSDLPHDLGNRLTYLTGCRSEGQDWDMWSMIKRGMEIDDVLRNVGRSEPTFNYINTLAMRREIGPDNTVTYHTLY